MTQVNLISFRLWTPLYVPFNVNNSIVSVYLVKSEFYPFVIYCVNNTNIVQSKSNTEVLEQHTSETNSTV